MATRFLVIQKADRSAEGDARVTFSEGSPTVTEGPFPDAQQVMAGFTIVEAASKQEAIDGAIRGPAVPCDGEIEVRELGCPNGLVGVMAAARSPGTDPQFLILLKANTELEAGVNPGESVLAAMAKRNQELTDAGVMLAGEGLQPSARGARVRFSKGKATVIDGPFTEAKELIAGFWLIQVKSREEAIEWVTQYPFPFPNVEVEIRQLH